MPNRLTETDLYRMKSLTQPIAHDKQYFATQTTVDEASNDYRGSLLGFTNTGELIGHFDNDNYSAKSAVAGATYLFFLSKKSAEDTYQVYQVPYDGGTAIQISNLAQSVDTLRVVPGTDTVFFSSRQTDEKPVAPYEKVPKVRRVQRLYYKKDNFGFLPTDGTCRLYSYTANDKTPTSVFESHDPFALRDVAADGHHVVFTMANNPDDDLDFGEGVYLLDTQTDTLTNLTDARPTWTFINAKFSPNSDKLLLIGHTDEFDVNTHNYVYGITLATGEFTDYTSELDEEAHEALFSDFPQNLDAEDTFWVTNEQFVFRTSWQGHSRFYLNQNGQNQRFFDEHARITNWAVANNQQLIVTYSTPTVPVKLATLAFDGTLTDLYNPNATFDANHEYVEPETFWYNASDGTEIEGWLYPPLAPTEKNPIVIDIHGGPHQAWTENFFFDIQLYANNGFGMLLLNPRGSKTYGQAFCQAVVGHYCEQDYTDLIEGLDHVLTTHPEYDANRQYCIGASYGGLMTTWAVGHTDRFAGAVAQKPVTDWISLAGTSDIGYYFIPQELQCSRFDAETLWRISPVAYAKNVKTPTLIIQGEWDARTPVGQAEEFFTALAENGTETVLSRHPQSWHAMSRLGLPNLRIERIKETCEWWQRH